MLDCEGTVAFAEALCFQVAVRERVRASVRASGVYTVSTITQNPLEGISPYSGP